MAQKLQWRGPLTVDTDPRIDPRLKAFIRLMGPDSNWTPDSMGDGKGGSPTGMRINF